MSFVAYDLSFLVIFTLAVAIFLYVERKKLQRDGPMFLYKTEIGLKLINYLGTRYKKTLKWLSYVVIATGYVLMAFSIYLIYQLIVIFTQPNIVKIIKIPPIAPLIPYLPQLFKVDYLPPFYFTYWIIAIALVAIAHEGFHGIFAKFSGVKIKSTGFGFLGPFLAFFVEQDDKQMQKSNPKSQLAILGAGVFANVLLSVIFFFLMVGFFNSYYTPSGVIFNDYSFAVTSASAILANGIVSNETLAIDSLNFTKIRLENKSYWILNDFFKFNRAQILENPQVKIYYDFPAIEQKLKGAITQINGEKITTPLEMAGILRNMKPGDKVTITTSDTENSTNVIHAYQITLAKDYDNSSRAVFGVATLETNVSGFKGLIYRLISTFKDPNINYEPKSNAELTIFLYTLLWWIFWINVSVAIGNMIPLGIFDGGRFFYLTLLVLTGKKKFAEHSFKWMTRILLAIIALLMVLWVWGIFF